MKFTVSLVTAMSICAFASVVNASNVADGDIVTFTANTAAKASEVNGNFTALKNAVNDNDTRITTNATAIDTKQNRVTGTCATGYVISINADGTVSCAGNSQITKWLNINVYGTNLPSNATTAAATSDASFGITSNGPVYFPDTQAIGQPQLNYDFIVPDDYVTGTAITLEIIWNVTGTAAGNVELRNNWGYYRRVGVAPTNFSATNPAAQVATALTYKTDMTLSSIFEPGDAIAHGIYRCVTCSTDTSTNPVILSGLRIRYTAQQ